jgi:hypothetical protein
LALWVGGFGSAHPTKQLGWAAFVQQREQLGPGGKSEHVDQAAGAVAEQNGPMQLLRASEPVMAWVAACGSAAATQ